MTIKHQVKTFGPVKTKYGERITAKVRFDDSCGNGHNTFSITGEIRERGKREVVCCGAIHGEVAKYFPELTSLLKYHLMSTDGPLHYVANTLYHSGTKEWDDSKKTADIDAARRSAIWPEATLEELQSKEKLLERLPKLIQEFRNAVESLGLNWD